MHFVSFKVASCLPSTLCTYLMSILVYWFTVNKAAFFKVLNDEKNHAVRVINSLIESTKRTGQKEACASTVLCKKLLEN